MIVHPLSTGLGLSFLLEEADGLFLVDCGSPAQEGIVQAKMRELGRQDLKLIWVTHAHYDHYGSAAALRNKTGALVGVHPADAPYMEAGLSPLGNSRGRGSVLVLAQAVLFRIKPLPAVKPDFLLQDGDRLDAWGLTGQILHTPGHTPGHSCLVLDQGIAFAGDLIARRPATRLQDRLAVNWSQLPLSLEKLKTARPELIYTGHSKVPVTSTELQKLAVRDQHLI